jgi:hypothetical protein
MRRLILFSSILVAAALAGSNALADTAGTALAQGETGQDRFVVFETFGREV